MMNDQLLNYIKQQLAKSVPKEIIANNLKSQGWTDEDLNEAFSSISGAAPTPPSPMSSDINPMSAQPVANLSNLAPHKSKKVSLIVSILILLALAGAGAYAYFTYSQKSQITLGGVLVNTLDAVRDSKIKSVEFSGAANIDANFKELDKTKEINNIETAFPDEVGLSVSWNGIFDGTVKDNFETYGKINLELKIDDPSQSQIGSMLGEGPQVIELEYYAFSDSVYLKLNKVPQIVDTYASSQGINLSNYLNRWFVVHETEMDLFKKGFLEGFKNEAKKDGKDFGEMNPFEFKITDEEYAKTKVALLKYIYESGVVSIVDRKSETSGDQNVTALYVKFNKDKYLPALKDFLTDLKAIYPDWFKDLNTDEILGDPSFNDSLMTMPDVNMKVFVGADGYFHGEEVSFNIKGSDTIPDITEKIHLDLMNYNKDFNLAKPENAENLVEVVMDIENGLKKK